MLVLSFLLSQKYIIEIGITGSIQRYHHSDVRIQYEGTTSQVIRFIAFLNLCRHQGMMSAMERLSPTTTFGVRRCDDFIIDRDFSRTVANGGKAIKGVYSDGDDYDKLSVYSANYPTPTLLY